MRLLNDMACELEIIFMESARSGMEDIVAYLATYSKAAAGRFFGQLRGVLENISSGLVVYGLSRIPSLAALDYRAAVFGDYVLLYYVYESQAFVAHVFDQRQDYARLVIGRDKPSEA